MSAARCRVGQQQRHFGKHPARAGTGDAPWPVLVTTANHPLLTVDMVETFIRQCGDAEIGIAAVERHTVIGSYPKSKRTWLKFADGAFSGANLFTLRGASAGRALELWAKAEQDRKQSFKLFWHFGPLLALRAITRTIGFGEAVRRAGRRLNLTASLIVLNAAEAAIDVDKASDHQLVEAILSGQTPQSARRSEANRHRNPAAVVIGPRH